MRSALPLAAIALASCQAAESLEWVAPPDTQSFVLALDDPRCEGRATCEAARAYAGNALREPFFLPEGEYQIYLLAFPFGLEALELIEGPLPSCAHPAAGPECRPGGGLPDTDTLFAAQISGREAGDFLPVPEINEAIRAIRFPRTPAENCANRGKCFLTEDRVCTDCPSAGDPVLPSKAADVMPFADFAFRCRERWVESDGICLPPEELPALPSGACARGTAQRRDRAGCEPIGAPCPEGQERFSALTPPGAIYVDGNAPIPGSGESPDAPLRTIAEALAVAAAGQTVSVAAGIYAECFATETRVLGACPALTRIDAVSCDGLELSGTAHLENLAIDGPIRVQRGAAATVEGVDADNPARGDCLHTADADLTVRNTIARNCDGAGLLAGGGKIVLEDFITEDAIYGFRAGDRARVDAERLVFRGGAVGFQTLDGVAGTVEDLLVEGTAFSGIYVDGADLSASDILVRDTRDTVDDPGRAIDLGATRDTDSEITLRGVVVERATTAGIAVVVASGRTSTVALSDVFVRELRGNFSHAVLLDGAVTATISRMAIAGADDTALALRRTARAELDGLVIREDHQRAIEVLGANAGIKNAKLSGAASIGALVEDGVLRLENARINGIARGAAGGGDQAAAIDVAVRGELRAQRVEIDDVTGAGVLARSTATLTDVAISNVRSPTTPFSARDGVALYADAAVVTGTRVSIVDAEQAVAINRSQVTLSDAFLTEVGRIESFYAIFVRDGALTLTRAYVRSPDKAIYARSSDLILTDVELFGPSVRPRDAALLALESSLVIERVVLDGRTSHGDGMALCDVTVDSARDFTIFGYGQGAAALIGAGEILDLNHFSFYDNFIGLVVADLCFGFEPAAPVINARDGTVLAQETGLRVISEVWDPASAMVRVRYVADLPIQMARGESR